LGFPGCRQLFHAGCLDKWLVAGALAWEDGLTVSLFNASTRSSTIIKSGLDSLDAQALFLDVARQNLSGNIQANYDAEFQESK
jgi:uncharacterized protein YqfA (UPF0365 family)